MKNHILHKYIGRIIFFLLIILIPNKMTSQVTVDVKIDSLEIWIGEQTGVTLQVSAGAEDKVEFPHYMIGDTLVKGVEVVQIEKPDTQTLNDGKRNMISQKYLITSFDSAFYYLPPFVVKVNDVEHQSNNLALRVLTIPVDTMHLDQFYGFKPNMTPAFTWEDWQPIFYLSLAALLLFIISAFLFIRLRDNKPIIKIIKSVPQILPHKQAMQEIDQIKQEKVWTKEDSKEYYTRLTGTLRTYIEKRFGFSAMEMTSSEIIEKLLEVQTKDQLKELISLFNTADLVKFAKYNTMINENDANLINAIEFINQTKPGEDELKAEKPKTITIEQKWKKSTLITIRVILGVAIILFIYLFSIAIWQMYNLLA